LSRRGTLSVNGVAKYLAELYQPAASLEGRIALSRAAGRVGRDVRYVRSIFLPDEETCFHEYESGSLEKLAEALARAGVAYQRLIAAEIVH
jgi:hypothetical protein